MSISKVNRGVGGGSGGGLTYAEYIDSLNGIPNTLWNQIMISDNTLLGTINAYTQDINTDVKIIRDARYGSITNLSGSIAVGGLQQSISGPNASRKYFYFQNISAQTLYLDFGISATPTTGINVPPGASFILEDSFISIQSISVLGAIAGLLYIAKEG